MRRGDVVWVAFDPVRGSEANKRRPAVVVSNDGASQTGKVYPFQVLLPAGSCGLPRASKAQAEQIRSVAVQRIGKVAGRLAPAALTDLEEAMRLHLGL